MIFEEMFESAKKALSKAKVADKNASVAMQITVTGDGEGIFYAKVANGVLDVQPYDYRDHDVSLTVDSTILLEALTKKKTEDLDLQGSPANVAVIRTILATIPAARKPCAKKTAESDATPASTKKATTKTATTTKAATTKATAAKTAEKPVAKTTTKSSTTKATSAKATSTKKDAETTTTTKKS